ncbi:hypothetical protein HYU14_04250 [Candidatus Woesearchaeota archaeon]|nr:hypothetical protein [Candidatus Woesearchaeota archaeon]
MAEGSSGEGGEAGQSAESEDSGSSHADENKTEPGYDNDSTNSTGNHNADNSGQVDTLDGAIAIISYEDKKTGQVYFKLEVKPADYGIPEYANRDSLIGGTIAVMNGRKEGGLEALLREIGEEVKNEDAQEVIISYLERNPVPYITKTVNVGGQPSLTEVYLVHITDAEEWEKVARSPLTHDAGPSKILTLEEIINKPEDDFAFDDKWIYEKYIKEKFPEHYNAALQGLPMPVASAPQLKPYAVPKKAIIDFPHTHYLPEANELHHGHPPSKADYSLGHSSKSSTYRSPQMDYSGDLYIRRAA